MGSSSSRPRPEQAQLLEAHDSAYAQPQGAGPGPQVQYAPPAMSAVTNGQLYGGYYHAVSFGRIPSPMQAPYTPGHYGQLPPHIPVIHEYQQLQVIRNQVNLKKTTLRLAPVEGSSTELELQFSFDASAPCRVSTFLLATEDPRQSCRIIAAAPEPRPPAYYQKGVDHQFPPRSDPVLSQQHRISLATHSPSLLELVSGDSYPLIIRLEALTEEATAEGKPLQQMEVGGPLPVWAQAQTTYAKLKKDDEGCWALQILKQKIWVHGTSYELQDIYGMESNRVDGSTTPAAEDVDGRECVICMSAERDTTVLPCRHMCMCQPCAAALRTQTNKCPICRKGIESLMHIKIQRKGPGQGLTPTSSVNSQDEGGGLATK